MGDAVSPEEGGQLLFQAATYGNAELVADLLGGEYAGEVGWKDRRGWSPLHAAASAGDAESIRALTAVASLAQIDSPSTPNDGSKTALHVAAEAGRDSASAVLIEAGADVFARDAEGHCPLELAHMHQHDTTAAAIIAAIEHRSLRLSELQKRVDTALEAGDDAQLKAALKEAGRGLRPPLLHGVCDEDYTLLYRIAEKGSVRLAEVALDFGADGRIHPVTLYSPLYIAAYAGNLAVLKLLIKKLPELVQRETFEGWLPAHAAARTGDEKVMTALLESAYPDWVLTTFSDPQGRRSFRFPFDLNAQDLELRTPLFVAAEQDVLSAIMFKVPKIHRPRRLILGAPGTSAEPAAAPHMATNAALGALLLPSNTLSTWHGPIVRMLLNLVVRLHVHSAEEEATTPTYEDVVFAAPPSPTTPTSPQHRPEEKQMMKARSKLNAVNISSESAMPKSISTQLYRPVLVDVYSKRGRTPLQVAVSGGHSDVCRALVLDGGANVNLPLAITDDELAALSPAEAEGLQCAGSGALVEACRRGRVGLGELLLEAGAKDHGNRALLSSLAGGHAQLAAQLLARLAFPDPEHRVNRKGLQAESQTSAVLRSGSGVLPSALAPTVAAMINWHEAGLSELQAAWLKGAAAQLNPKLADSPSPALLLSAITRLDVSGNSLESVPAAVFQLSSLKILNLSRNNLADLPAPSVSRGRAHKNPPEPWTAAVLEELNLSRNALANLPDAVFCLAGLTSLDASHNLLQDISKALWSAPKLKELNLSYNRLGRVGVWWSGMEVAELRPGSAASASSQESSGPSARPSATRRLNRHNIWQRSVQLSKDWDSDEEGGREAGSAALLSLNVAANELESVPECLACVAPNLTRLNLSGNSLPEIGPASVYPPKLKHLDLSHNRIMYWFSAPRSSADLACYAKAPAESPASRDEGRISPSAGRRAGSRIRGSRSMSLASRGCDAGGAVLVGANAVPLCAHKRHRRLDNLRTLVLAGNRLDSIRLSLDPRCPSRLPAPSAAASARAARASVSADAEPRERLLFPLLSMLDLSANQLAEVPRDIADLSALSVLNLSENHRITALPPEMGLLGKLWNLSLSGCSLDEPLKSMLESNKYKTMDIIGYLKSVLQDSKPYARMKLMVVGVEGIGKTSLLEQLQLEGTVSVKKTAQNDSWARRMGKGGTGTRTAKGESMSTVGVELSDWAFEPKRARGEPRPLGPITFRTWDFAGQREYYATHQYFLSRRSVYLVLWRATDGEAGINDTLQWILNIQARAPNAPVIIVGTHFDEILANSQKFPPSYVDDLQQMIRDRFVTVQDADKKGLPRVVESVVVSCKSRYNIRHLAGLIYWTAAEMRGVGGAKEPLLAQKIPATYVALEEAVVELADARRRDGLEPVLGAAAYAAAVAAALKRRGAPAFRDAAELAQATSFLHDNGVLLHYDDATLKDLYFLDPQWLCDVLAHVITIREINPFAKNGLMRVEDLRLLFKTSKMGSSNLRSYILNLLQKFEVGMTWDNRNLLLPSLLPDEYQIRAGYANTEVRVPVRCEGWVVPSLRSVMKSPLRKAPPLSPELGREAALETATLGTAQTSVPILRLQPEAAPTKPSSSLGTTLCWAPVSVGASVRRLYLMSYIPAGFWSRLLIRVLGDEQLSRLWDAWFEADVERPHSEDPVAAGELAAELAASPPSWLLWQTGLEVRLGGELLFSLKEFLPLAEIRDVNYAEVDWKILVDGAWHSLRSSPTAIVEVWVPLRRFARRGDAPPFLRTQTKAATRLIALVVELIDTLLEDWYPSLGTRFVHTSEGRLLVSRLVPCPACLEAAARAPTDSLVNRDWTLLAEEDSARRASIFAFTAEQCILCGDAGTSPSCPDHGPADLVKVAPDTVFHDVGAECLIQPHQVSRGKMLGRGAFGFVFKATVKRTVEEETASESDVTEPASPVSNSTKAAQYLRQLVRQFRPSKAERRLRQEASVATEAAASRDRKRRVFRKKKISVGEALAGPKAAPFKAHKEPSESAGQRVWVEEVALKLLQPVEPGLGSRASAVTAYKAAAAKWEREPEQYACRAYCTARQELKVLRSLRHPHIVALVGLCPRPLALVVALAPLGALNSILNNYRRSGARLHRITLRDTALQVARALEYLHQEHIIYRDLKSENVLVWRFPQPFTGEPHKAVDVRLGDYGISRSVFPSGGAKGFGGTEGFMAPEIMRYNGEEEYTEKVDVFSYAMFLYELVGLKLPYEGQEQVKEQLLEGGRPRLRPSELLQPANVLDLMVVGWAGSVEERPSASQLVSVVSSPEFPHLLDVVALPDPDSALLAAEAFAVPTEDTVAEGLDGEVWLSRADGHLSVLSLNQDGWLDCRSVFVGEDSFVTAMCLVEDTLWLGELTGLVRVFCAATYAELHTFPLGPHLETEPGKPRLSLPVAAIAALPSLRRVVLATQAPPALLVATVADNLGGVEGSHPVVAKLALDAATEIHCMCWVPSAEAGKVELWTGESGGFMSVVSVGPNSLKRLDRINHYSPPVEGVEVSRLLASPTEPKFVWSYVYPGSVLYQWSAPQRLIVSKLDCAKLMPVSESLSTINIEEKMSPGKCQVSSLCLVEKDGGAEIYIGTSWGVLIVASADKLRPVTAFRSHVEEVGAVVAVSWAKKASVWSSAVEEDGPSSPPLLLSVGKGYRSLIHRFLDNYREDSELLESRNKDIFAVLWSTDDWVTC